MTRDTPMQCFRRSKSWPTQRMNKLEKPPTAFGWKRASRKDASRSSGTKPNGSCKCWEINQTCLLLLVE